MGDTSKYLVYLVNIGKRNDNFGRTHISFGDVCFEIEFAKACSSKLVISLRKIIILRIKVKDMKKTCWR